MSEERSEKRFDLSYRGLLAPDADPEHTRRRLSEIFKLTDKGAERLFTGRSVIVKRDVDAATAARFEKVFAQAGAILTITPVEGAEAAQDAEAVTDSGTRTRDQATDTAPLSLAPQGGPLEQPPAEATPVFDLSYLALVPGDDWTFVDCEPLPTPIPQLDISYLSLVPSEPRLEDTADARLDQ
jgi:hypothetical protein